MLTVVIASFVLGVVSGLRTMLAAAALFLARGGVSGYVLAVAAVAELVSDQLPTTPPRTAPPQLIVRILSGAVVGYFLCSFLNAPPFAGVIAGVVGALAGTYGGKAVRLWLIDRIGAIPAALVEDLIGIALAVAVVVWLTPVPRI
jgi:uncharacterized membrane protein